MMRGRRLIICLRSRDGYFWKCLVGFVVLPEGMGSFDFA
jgi:hypothetical protein